VAVRLLPVLPAAERGHVEVVVRAADLLGAARVGRVGMKDAFAVAQEGARAVQLAWELREPRGRPLLSGRELYSTGATLSSSVTWKS